MKMTNKDLLADHKNCEIVRLLQRRPRATISEIARKIGMSNPAVKERVIRLEESGIVEGYRLDLDPKKLGYQVMAFVRIRPLAGHVNKIAELVQSLPQVTECHRITGEDCFILKVYVKEISNLDRILDKFLAHGQTTTSIVQSSPVPWRSLPLTDRPDA